MSQKIVIPKGTIDSAHTTIIEIPNYLHETSTVIVTTPRTADPELEEAWEENEYAAENSSEQNENWEQDFETSENNDTEYLPDQQEDYQYTPANEEMEGNVETQPQQQFQRMQYQEELQPQPQAQPQPPRRPVYDQYTDQMRRRLMDKKTELVKLRSERQRLVEGEIGTYEGGPQMGDLEDVPAANPMAEVPESMRGRSAPSREVDYEKERRRRQMMEAERSQSRSINRSPHGGYKQGYPRDQSSPKYVEMRNQRYPPPNVRPPTNQQQWNPDVHGYPDMPYARQGQPRPQYHPAQMRPMPNQMNYMPEDLRQYQKARRKPMFSVPRN